MMVHTLNLAQRIDEQRKDANETRERQNSF